MPERSFNTLNEALFSYEGALGVQVAGALKMLLESKHLYQAVTVDESPVSNFWETVQVRVKERTVNMDALKFGVGEVEWSFAGIGTQFTNARSSFTLGVHIYPPHARMFCKTCGRVEPFNFRYSTGLIEDAVTSKADGKPQIEQVYAFSYLCQGCQKLPEVFLIRRTGAKLTLCGRSPMEHVPVPPEIPKEVAKYYSGAVVAYQSGQALAALFMLRTTCEQWARRFADPADKADVAIDKYMASLPEDFKARFPSLRDMYSDLSADIHAAKGSDALFEDILDKLGLHFRARQLYESAPKRA